MRVITGTARGRKLEALSGVDVTRPTTDSTKEALFSMIQFEIEGAVVLDLFAGSGQLGIEALSRGAGECTFVEMNKDAYNIIEKNVSHCDLTARSVLVKSDAISFLSRGKKFDIAFLDPPYNQGLITKSLPLLIPNMNEDGVIICETERNESLEESVLDWKIVKEKNYGKTKLTLYRKEK